MNWDLAALVAAFATPLSIYISWRTLAHTVFSMKQAKTQRLYELINTGEWINADSFVLRQAVADAYQRKPPPARTIKFAIEHPDSWEVLRDITLVDHLVKLDESGSRLVDVRAMGADEACAAGRKKKFKWPSYRTLSWGSMVSGIMASYALMALGIYEIKTSPAVAIIAISFSFVLGFSGIIVTIPLGRAQRLLDIDEKRLSAMNHAFLSRCAKSSQLSLEVWRASMGQEFPADPRDALALAASALAHEHHSSIVELVRTGHYAGAAALLRPLIEACLSATWLMYCATEAEANELLSENRFLPKPSRMWESCSKNSQVGDGVSKFRLMMESDGVIFHKFTHGDMPQLSRRFRDGKVQIPFSELENATTLINADLFLMIAGDIAGVAYSTPGAKAAIGKLMHKTLLEASDVFGTPFEWQEPWVGMPAPNRA